MQNKSFLCAILKCQRLPHLDKLSTKIILQLPISNHDASGHSCACCTTGIFHIILSIVPVQSCVGCNQTMHLTSISICPRFVIVTALGDSDVPLAPTSVLLLLQSTLIHDVEIEHGWRTKIDLIWFLFFFLSVCFQNISESLKGLSCPAETCTLSMCYFSHLFLSTEKKGTISFFYVQLQFNTRGHICAGWNLCNI